MNQNQSKNLVAMFISHAQRYADKTITFLNANQGQHISVNYLTLLGNSLAVLEILRKSLQAREVVILCIDDPQELVNYFWACILGGYIPLSLRAQKPQESQDKFFINEQIFALWKLLKKPKIITTVKLSEFLQQRFKQECSEIPNFVLTEKPILNPILNSAQSELNLQHVIYPQPQDIAFLVISSGSTGLSKIVMVKQGQLLTALASKQSVYTQNPEHTYLNWMPLTHVTGLIECHISSIYNGIAQIHLPILDVTRNPIILLRYLSELRISFTLMPNFAFDMLSSAYEEAAGETLDLSELKYIIATGTLVVYNCVHRFMKTLSSTGLSQNALVPAWGMAETCADSVFNLKFSVTDGDNPTFISLGPPLPGIQLRVVDAQGQHAKEEEVGKLEVTGPMVTSGFFNDPTQTAAYFTSDGWYKTGDLAYLKKGELYLVSREGSSITLRGKTIYHHEIESVVNIIHGINPRYTCAATVTEPDVSEEEAQQSLILFASMEEGHDNEPKTAMAIRQICDALQSEWNIVPQAIIILPPKEILMTPDLYKIKKNLLQKNYLEHKYESQQKFYHRVVMSKDKSD